MQTINVTLKLSKTTKGTYVYSDDSDGAPIRSQYIQRDAIKGDPPQAIEITVKAKS